MILLIEGIVLGLVIGVLLLLPALNRSKGPHWESYCSSNMRSVSLGIALYCAGNKDITAPDYEAMVATEMLSYKCLQCPLQHRNEEFKPTEKNIDYVYTLRGMNLENLPPDMLMLDELPDKHCYILQVDGLVKELHNEDVFRRKIQECNDFLANSRGVQK